MITPTHKPPISRQTKLLGLARSTAYYQPKPVAESDQALMAAMDRLHLDYPFWAPGRCATSCAAQAFRVSDGAISLLR